MSFFRLSVTGCKITRELAEQFGVSSIPVREALQELENRGLVTKRPNYSSRVIELSQEELDQLFELRGAIIGAGYFAGFQAEGWR